VSAAAPSREAAVETHLLSVDVEEYFQVEAAARAGLDSSRWPDMPRRLAAPVDRLLDLLAARGVRATFFILGWVARADPNLVRRIAAAGHEVASHGMTHRMLNDLAPDAFRAELAESRQRLEDLAGRPVRGFRAPTFSITHRTAWGLDALAEAGYVYDSSIFPVHHDRYGVPEAPVGVHRAVGPGGAGLLEIPPLTLRALGANWPAAGGGYLRLLPVRVIGHALRAAARDGRTGMIYLHPWELDPDQPVLPMSRLARFRHRVGLARTEAKLRWLLDRFRFTSVADRLDALLRPPLPSFTYGAT